MIDFHRERHAGCTVAALPVRPHRGRGQFGIIEVDEQWRIVGFEEKPADPKPIAGDPTKTLVSMGNYIFDTEVLEEVAAEDHATPTRRTTSARTSCRR